jgi:2-dehydro-3-deoxygluconokinase
MHDLVTLGEVLLRLSVPPPGRIETARQLDVQIGGAEANVAATCARLGLRTAWISALPDNVWGERVRRELNSHGVDCSYVLTLSDARLGAYFVEYGVAPRSTQVLYDRRDSAFARLTLDLVDWVSVRRAHLVHVSGVTPALGDNSRALVRHLVEQASALSFDMNYRAALWTPDQARDFAESILPRVRYFFLGRDEARIVFRMGGPPEEVLESLASLAPKATIALLQSEEGSTVLDAGRLWKPAKEYRVQMIDPIGAGDAYAAGFLWCALKGRTTQDCVDAGSAVAALKCASWGDIGIINERDVAQALSGGPDVRR